MTGRPPRARRDDRHRLGRRVVDYRQALHGAPLGRAVEDEVRRPDLVRGRRPHQRLTVGDRDLLASTPAYLQARLRVQALDALVVDPFAGLPQLQVDHPGPIATMAMRQCLNACAEGPVPVGGRCVPQRRGAHAHHGQGTSLAQALLGQVPHHRATGWCGYHFFAAPLG